ncbi:MAG: GNAT family N-acetyltransferase, partial [Bacteroidota bacterium]
AQRVAIKKLRNQEVFVWIDQAIVSMACIARPSNHGISINYVYTPPGYRGQGYATSLVAQLSQRMLDRSFAFCTLFTDANNPTSNRIYQKIGYYPIATFKQIDFLYEEAC